jgi:hypothetical protein
MGTFLDANIGEFSTSQGPTTDANEDINSFYRRLEDGLRELYPGCKKFTKIAFILKMLHIKAICNISNKAFDMMIDLIKKALPVGEALPTLCKKAMRLRRVQKVLRYFPIKPQLQRFFMMKEIAEEMRWHKDKQKDNGNTLRHPADSIMWKDFDKRYNRFASDSRNVRLGLASDGFNPFCNMSTTNSIWPVILKV